jgi:hypothetical protein
MSFPRKREFMTSPFYGFLLSGLLLKYRLLRRFAPRNDNQGEALDRIKPAFGGLDFHVIPKGSQSSRWLAPLPHNNVWQQTLSQE